MVKKDLEYSIVEESDIKIPEQINAGLYTGNVLFNKKPWGNEYLQPKVNPDAVSYAAQFYAPHHIPSYNRPGNNTLDTNLYSQNNANYNFKCYV